MDTIKFYQPASIRGYNWAGSTNPNISSLADTQTSEGLSNNGFKVYNINTIEGYGLTNPSETNKEIVARTLTADLAALTDGYYSEGDVVNSGFIDTLSIINHRNEILTGRVIPVENDDFSMQL
jgi:hypothetical protein